ncbi:YMGG-like glycine zipper-containing protein [Synoicihabitans lomoniglobus]|uniref:YMGG-like glycine zipper-containing protein n=1 Tax=Synoicihabitans lomoniglobus TaxID=2909285 RepID=A0AAF0CN97_9BACT|nr:YMGG-like glycine zipper-containing protein [Opitutaceae bacterium LMO-M01]WED65223.1 YMGG-like glycine zipper-containing protein [Opitutaceae bacterium LMO-M01]
MMRSRIALATLLTLTVFSGCKVAPSKTAKGAGIGAVGGALAGAAIGNNSGSGNSASGAAIGGAAGALVGGAIGLVQDMKERSQQDQLAQERAYQQEVARRRQEEARLKDQLDEELSIAQGFRITDTELADAQRRADETSSRLAELKAEREWALNRKKELDNREAQIAAETAEIARLEAELAELRGDTTASNP